MYTEKKRADTMHRADPQTKETTTKVAEKPQKVKYCTINGVKYEREFAVSQIRSEFTKFDNTLLSKVLHPEYYGIQLIPEAVRALTGKRDSHHYTKRIQARLSDAAYATLTKHIDEAGYPSVNAWLVEMVMKYMREEGLIDV